MPGGTDDRAEQVASVATGPYFSISPDHPHYEVHQELGLLRGFVDAMREELRQGALRSLNGVTKVNNLRATVDDIAELTGRQALLMAANPYLNQMEDSATIHDGIAGLEAWIGQVESELDAA